MSDIAIRANGLGKLYHIGRRRQAYRTLRETMGGTLQRLRTRPATADADPTIWALRRVSFDIRQGEVMGVIGGNGAGKSTLLKILTRITEPTEGYVELRGRVGSLLEVGTGFHPELTGRENVYLNGAILGMRRAEIAAKFDEIVAFAEIDKFLDTPVKRYSSGMYVRLAFAVAAHLEPEILLVDEVLAVGDVAFQQKCLGKMGEVARGGRTVLFVSHNLAAVRRLCSSAILLRQGQLAGEGSPDAIIDEYLLGATSAGTPVVTLPAGAAEAPGEGLCLRFSGEDGAPRTQFHMGEQWRVLLEFRMRQPAAQVIGAIGLATSDGVPIITYWSQPADLAAGVYRVEFRCAAPIAHSDVHVIAGLSSREHSFYYIDPAARVSIDEIAVGAQPFRASGAGLLFSQDRPTIEVATP